MVRCCGRRTGAKDEDLTPLRSRPSASRISFLASETTDEGAWKVGGRYKVQVTVPIFESADLVQQTGTLGPKDEVLLLHVDVKALSEVALVVPEGSRREEGMRPGWIVLRDAASEKSSLIRKRLEGSWEVGGRYCVRSEATVRQDARLASKEVGEVEPGQEVVVLDLGIDKTGEARLRALVSHSASDILGWISPETAEGERLLDPVNLLGMEVVAMHRKTLAASSGASPARARVRCGRNSQSSGGSSEPGPRRSCIPGSTIPWEVGGKYRVLERLAVRERPELTSREVGKAAAGALATVTDIHNVECAHLGWCPCAFITIDAGLEEAGVRGWVRCAAKDGHDLLDTRDQLESEKILSRLRASQVARPPEEPPAGEGEEEANPELVASWHNTSESTSDQSGGADDSSEVGAQEGRRRRREGREESSSDEAQGTDAAKGKTGGFKLGDLEVTREDRQIGSDANIMEGQEKAICCNCGTGGRKP